MGSPRDSQRSIRMMAKLEPTITYGSWETNPVYVIHEILVLTTNQHLEFQYVKRTVPLDRILKKNKLNVN